MIDYKLGIGNFLGSNDNIYRGIGMDANGYGFSVFASPSEYIFGLPENNDSFLYIDTNSSFRYSLFPIASSINGLNNFFPEGTDDIRSNISNLIHMHSGDMYIGKYARGYFSDCAAITSDNYRSYLYLWDDGAAELSGYNFKIKTEDSSIEIYSDSSVPLEYDGEELPVFGDMLYVKKNLSNNINSSMCFNKDGGVDFGVMYFDNKPLLSLSLKCDGSYDMFIKSNREDFNYHLNISPSGNVGLLFKDSIINFNGISMSGKSVSGNIENMNFVGNASVNGDINHSGNFYSSGNSFKALSQNIYLDGSVRVNGILSLNNAIIGPGGTFGPGMPYRSTLNISINGMTYFIPLL